MRPRSEPRAIGGIALVAVLWIIAALAIVVGGVQLSVRSELRIVGASRQTVESVALGEAAVMLALQDMVAVGERLTRQVVREYGYLGKTIPVEITPLNGLIDINRASELLLASMYAVGGGLSPQVAADLAGATVQARTRRDIFGREQGFDAVQDLLQVPGVNYDLYARLSPLMTVEAQGSGKVNPLAAPEEVLVVLAGGNVSHAQAIRSRRDAGAGPSEIDTTVLNGEFISVSATTRYRIQARVASSDGGGVAVVRFVDLRPDSVSGMPWRIFNAEHWMIAPR